MAVRNEDMTNVGAWGDAHPEGCFHFRLASVKDEGGDEVFFRLVNQTEPLVGRTVSERFEMSKPAALSKLRTYYNKADYHPAKGEGHDPMKVEGAEFYAVVKHNISGGKVYANIEPWSIRSMQEGPAQPIGITGA